MMKTLILCLAGLFVCFTAKSESKTWLNWSFDDGKAGDTAVGTAVNRSKIGLAGTYHGDGKWSSDTKTGSGTSFYANFAKKSAVDYVNRMNCVDYAITDCSAKDRIYEMDFKLTDEVSWGTQYIFEEYLRDGRRYGGVFIRAHRLNDKQYTIIFAVRGGGGANFWWATGVKSIVVGKWHHAKLVIHNIADSENGYEAWLDGVEIHRTGGGVPAPLTKAPIFRLGVGAKSDSAGPMSGFVDNFVIKTTTKP